MKKVQFSVRKVQFFGKENAIFADTEPPEVESPDLRSRPNGTQASQMF